MGSHEFLFRTINICCGVRWPHGYRFIHYDIDWKRQLNRRYWLHERCLLNGRSRLHGKQHQRGTWWLHERQWLHGKQWLHMRQQLHGRWQRNGRKPPRQFIHCDISNGMMRSKSQQYCNTGWRFPRIILHSFFYWFYHTFWYSLFGHHNLDIICHIWLCIWGYWYVDERHIWGDCGRRKCSIWRSQSYLRHGGKRWCLDWRMWW